MRWLDGIIDLMDMSLSKFQDLMTDMEAWHFVVDGITKSQTQLSDLTELMDWEKRQLSLVVSKELAVTSSIVESM